MFDPNSTMAQSHEARVTMRGVRLTETGLPVQVSTRSDFIAPDQSPVALIETEMAKGLKGWTDSDIKPELVGYNPKTGRGVNNALPTGHAERVLSGFTAGTTVLRTARPATPGKSFKVWR